MLLTRMYHTLLFAKKHCPLLLTSMCYTVVNRATLANEQEHKQAPEHDAYLSVWVFQVPKSH